MSDTQREIPLLMFAKAPIAGKVKTRLTTDCSDEQAAEIAKIIMHESLHLAIQNWPGQVYLSVWHDADHPFILEMLATYNVKLLHQVPGDLGYKMSAAFDEVGFPAAIMGCDAPLVNPEMLKLAHSLLLNEQKNVLGPSADGGYYFIGLSESAKCLFEQISWGSAEVLTETLRVADQQGIKIAQLEESDDIDRWEDVKLAALTIPYLADYLRSQTLN